MKNVQNSSLLNKIGLNMVYPVYLQLRSQFFNIFGQIESDSIYLKRAESNWIKKLRFIRVLHHLRWENICFESFSNKRFQNIFYNSYTGLFICKIKIKVQYQNGRYETKPFISYFTPNHFHSGSLGMWSLWSENQQGQLKFRILEEGEI